MKAKHQQVLLDIEDNADLVVGKKFNGYNETIIIAGGEIRVFNRSGTEQTYNIPHITGIIVPRELDLVLPCEGIAPSGRVEDAKSIFGSSAEYALDWQCTHGFATMIAVNIIRYNRRDLKSTPFGERLDILKEVVAYLQSLGMDYLRQEILHHENKAELFHQITTVEMGEGVVVKSLSGTEKDWFKVKTVRSWDAVIMGFTEGKGKYTNTIGAIIYGFFLNGTLTETGRCSGMTDAERYMFSSSPQSFINRVIELQGQEIGNQGGIVFPRFVRLRDDRTPESCFLEELL